MQLAQRQVVQTALRNRKYRKRKNMNSSANWIVGVVVIGLLILMLIRIVMIYDAFTMELKRLNCEIGRTKGAEQQHWLRKRRRLWLSLIPFVKY